MKRVPMFVILLLTTGLLIYAGGGSESSSTTNTQEPIPGGRVVTPGRGPARSPMMANRGPGIVTDRIVRFGGMMGIEGILETQEPGIVVTAILPDSPAQRAGLIRGDIVLTFDGQEVNSLQEIHELLGDYEAGQRVSLGITRGGQPQTITLNLETKLNQPLIGFAGQGQHPLARLTEEELAALQAQMEERMAQTQVPGRGPGRIPMDGNSRFMGRRF
jgi:membrane-associated protease RseP (regulator of RpoE activity)